MVDTSAYTHLGRAGHATLFGELAPGGIVVVPSEVEEEIERARSLYPSILPVREVVWAELAVLDEDEVWTSLEVKAQLGGPPRQHLGECAVIAWARHNGGTAVLDDAEAVAQADRLGVPVVGTMWIVVHAFETVFDGDRSRAEAVVDDLLATDMYLPVRTGSSLFAWAYEEGLLP